MKSTTSVIAADPIFVLDLGKHKSMACLVRSAKGCGLCLLRNLLDHPEEEVGGRLVDPEPFQLGGDLTAVVGGVIDNVA